MGKRAPLRMTWSKREQDFVLHYDKSSADGSLIHNLFTMGAPAAMKEPGETYPRLLGCQEINRRLRETLRNRGFDPDTFQISVKRLKSESV